VEDLVAEQDVDPPSGLVVGDLLVGGEDDVAADQAAAVSAVSTSTSISVASSEVMVRTNSNISVLSRGPARNGEPLMFPGNLRSFHDVITDLAGAGAAGRLGHGWLQ
jgi:hypothetical protein